MNMLHEQPRPLKRLLLLLWLIFSVAYVAWNEYNRFSLFVMQRSYQSGRAEAVAEIMQQGAKCQPVPLAVGDQKTAVIDLNCLTKGNAAPAKAPAAPAPDKK